MPKGGKHYSNLQPRFSMAYNWGRDVVSLDISRMAQFYHYFRFYGMDFPTDLRMPSINQFKPQTSVHTELGWKHYLNGGYTNASIYYKQRDKILFVNPEAYYSSENWKNFLLEGRGESYGLKLSFSKAGRRYQCRQPIHGPKVLSHILVLGKDTTYHHYMIFPMSLTLPYLID